MSPAFAYRAVDSTGQRRREHAEAAEATSLARSLQEQGLLVLDAESAESALKGAGFCLRFGHRREVLEVTRAMALRARITGRARPLQRILTLLSSFLHGAFTILDLAPCS